jgi:hypothetical protein
VSKELTRIVETREVARIVRQTSELYHGDQLRISRSQLNDFITSRRLFLNRHVLHLPSWQQHETDAMREGTMLHSIMLDHGGDMRKCFTLIPRDVLNGKGDRVGNAWLQFKRDHAGETLLKYHEVSDLVEMCNAVRENETASELLFGGEAAENEQTFHWSDRETGLKMRARIDRVRPGHAIVDLKTIDTADLPSIEKAIEHRLYYLQAAVYQRAWEEFTGACGEMETLPFVLVFVEKKQPFRVVNVEIDSGWILAGRTLSRQTIEDVAECFRTDNWTDPTSVGIITMERSRFAANNWRKKL